MRCSRLAFEKGCALMQRASRTKQIGATIIQRKRGSGSWIADGACRAAEGGLPRAASRAG